MFKDVVAVVVTWNPEGKDFLKSFNSYRDFFQVVIVDNGSDSESLGILEALQSDSCTLIKLKENKGIAEALNIGIDYGKTFSAKKYLLLDQDSCFDNLAIDILINTYENLVNAGVTHPIVGPVPYSRESKKPIGMYQDALALESTSKLIEVESIYTSGMLISEELATSLKQLSYFFIDYVDTEWCYRARALLSAKVYIVPDAILYHKVGEAELGLLNMRSKPLLVHAPIRQYYQLRNSIWMLGMNYIPWKTRCRIFFRCLARVLLISIAVAPRLIRIKYVFIALLDGLKGYKNS